MHIKFWSGSLKVREYSEDLIIDGENILECVLRKLGVRIWDWIELLRVWSSGGLPKRGGELSNFI